MSESVRQPGSLLRPDEGAEAHRVTYVELFFDLVFVFAVTQISHSLIEHPDVVTLLQTLILIAAVWRVWVDTTWVTNWLNPENPRVRGMLFVLMLLGVLMSSAIPGAFGEHAMLFAASLVTLQLGRSVFAAIAFRRSRPENARNFVRMAIWNIGTGAAVAGRSTRVRGGAAVDLAGRHRHRDGRPPGAFPRSGSRSLRCRDVERLGGALR